MRVTGVNTYGVQPGGPISYKKSNSPAFNYGSFFQQDSFINTNNPVSQVINYYKNNVNQNNAPYPSSNCYVADIEGAKAALAKLKEEADSFDYTGMSDGEIFKAVFDRYADYFGTDFINISWQQEFVYTHELPSDNVNLAYRIWDQFRDEAYPHIDNIHEAYKYFYGYEGMSDEEVKAAIYGECAVTGGTYAAFAKMADKLYHTGLINQDEFSSLLNSVMSSAQYQKNEPPISVMFYEKYGNLLHAYYESMDMDEIGKLWDKALAKTTYYGSEEGIKKSMAADQRAREIFNELREVLKAAK